MDPDGTNRIVKQQIKEWHTIVDQERTARLLEPENATARWRLLSGVRDGLAQIARRALSGRLRHPSPDAPPTVIEP